jgi:hypothetical protein
MKKILSIVALLLLTAGLASAQVTTGTLVGSVHDSSGALIPNAPVTATDKATGVVYSGKTNSSGLYRLGNLPAGTYDVLTSSKGFAPVLLKDVVVDANATLTKDFSLGVGTSASVEVSSEASVSIDTTDSQLGTTFTAKEIQDLPTATVGLGVLNLSLLAPGVATSGGLGAGTGPSVGGQRPRNNNFEIDGMDNNSKSVTGPELYVPNDAVGEFTLLTNFYGAQYGHSTGGQFNELVVSGGNQIRGRLYEYFENRNLNAVDPQQAIANVASGKAPGFKPRYDFNRYGGQLGGPVLKDKLFLFSNFERQTTGQAGSSSTFCSPTAAGFTALKGAGVASANNLSVYSQYSPAAATQALATNDPACNGQYISVPNSTGTINTPVAVGDVSLTLSAFTNYYFSTSSLDYTISPKDSLRVRYVYNREDGPDTAATFPVFFTTAPTRLHLISAHEVHTFTPNISNDFMIGYNRVFSGEIVPPISFPGLSVFPNLVFDELNSVNLGPDPNAPQSTIQNLYEASDAVTWVKGKHTIVIGGEARKYISPQVFVQRLRGDYDYLTLGRYLNDLSPDDFGQRNATPVGVSPTYYGDQTQFYGFGNDDFKLTPKLTVNLGLRYEFTSLPASEKLQSLNSAASVSGLISFSQPTPQYKNFAPRIGFAYAPDQNTSIRAGFGMGYDVLYDNIGLTTAPPQFQTTESVNIGVTTTGFLAGGGLPANTNFANLAAQRAATTGFVPNQKLPYAESYTLGIQHVFHNDYTAEVRYLGTHGVHLDLQDRLNIQSPVTQANQLPTVYGGSTSVTAGPSTLASLKAVPYIIPAYSAAGLTNTIVGDMPYGSSSYNGLATQLTRRMHHGLSLNVAYTYSKTMDNSTADFNTTALNPRRPQDFGNINADYSLSALSRKHRLTVLAVYDLPFFKTGNWFMKNLAGNWEITPVYTFQSPQPTTVQSGIDSNLNNDSATDRVFINPGGVKGTGASASPIYNPSISCGTSTASTYALQNGTTTVAKACTAQIIGYAEGLITHPTSTTSLFTPSNAYFVQGGSGTQPTASRSNLFTGRINDVDISAYKRFNVYKERYKIEFGAQAFNLFNHPQFLPGSLDTVNSITSTGYRNFDLVTSSQFNQKQLVFSGNPRVLQLSGKIIF